MRANVIVVCAICAVMAAAQQPAVTSQTAPALSNLTFTTQDYIDIQQLYARYGQAIDSGERNGEAWAETFTPDGVFNKTNTGRQQLVAFAKNWHENRGGAHIQHWNTQLVITPTADGARGSCYLMLVDSRTQPPSIMSIRKYDDVLVKTAQGWRPPSSPEKGVATARFLCRGLSGSETHGIKKMPWLP